ncbi:hypothetical protein KR026_010690 [Drosophila bipectinata]|nr:hypothetical protein KR026_010690 [Drosophila bipectinata]
MSKLTIADYLCKALTKLEPPTDWEDILEFVLASLNCPFRHKYYTKKLTQALEVGLRFGIIRKMNNKYYLYEYAKISSRGEITYEFTPNPLTCMEEEATEEENTEEEDTVEEDMDEDEESDEEEKKEAKKIKS